MAGGITDNKNAKHYYLKNRTGLYPGYPKPETTRLILTEAIIDAGHTFTDTGSHRPF